MTITQGDTYPIYIDLFQDDQTLTPDLIKDLEICIGKTVHKSHLRGEIQFDAQTQRWWIWPTKDETLALPVGRITAHAHVIYPDGCDYTCNLGVIDVTVGCCRGKR